MTTNNNDATLTGILFILAAITSMMALKLYDPILASGDYLISGYENESRIILGVLFELILVACCIGTAIILFPWLKKEHEGLAMGYVSFRLLEAVIIIIGIFSILAMLSLSREYISSSGSDNGYYKTSAIILKTIHSRSFMLGPNFMLGINTLICSYLLYKSMLVPRFISVMGLSGGVFILYAALLELFGIILQLSAWGITLAIPLFLYEMTLAFWLIFRGFNATAVKKTRIALQT